MEKKHKNQGLRPTALTRKMKARYLRKEYRNKIYSNIGLCCTLALHAGVCE
ncbi:MAG: hypothetical protein LBQ31_03495 [Bacteroidales bacterium]|nr:hypothetical protein [Bacteroidales bacterium]